MEETKPSVGVQVLPSACRQSLEEKLLNASLNELRAGELAKAVESLKELVEINREEPRYAQLLAMARRKLQTESWYRYQKRFQLGWASN